MKKVLEFVRYLLRESQGPSSQYREGYRTALEDVEEFITDEMWEEGEE